MKIDRGDIPSVEELQEQVIKSLSFGFESMMWFGVFGSKQYLKFKGKKLWLHKKARTRK